MLRIEMTYKLFGLVPHFNSQECAFNLLVILLLGLGLRDLRGEAEQEVPLEIEDGAADDEDQQHDDHNRRHTSAANSLSLNLS